MRSRRRSATVPTKSGEQVSLTDFMRNKLRAACAVCKIPKEVRAQLGRAATKKGFTQENQIEWLCALGYRDVKVETLRQHVSARHDSEEDFNGTA